MGEYELPWGLIDGPNKLVCAKHFSDQAIAGYVNESGFEDECDYCGGQRVVTLESLVEFLLEAVIFFYSDPTGFSPWDGGFAVNTYDSEEVLFDEFELDLDSYQLDKDIRDWLDPGCIWADEKGYRGEDSGFLLFPWRIFKDMLKRQSRFHVHGHVVGDYHGQNVTVADFLRSLLVEIDKLKLSTVLTTDTELFRSRLHPENINLDKPADFASPPSDFANQPNRMSPPGVSMFYGALDVQTAIRETVSEGCPPLVTVAVCKPKSDLVVLDLTKIPSLPSRFDALSRDNYFILDFLTEFTLDFARPILRDGKEHIEYLPTQFITEHFKDFMKIDHKKIDGILYPSTKNKNGRCIVLFIDHQQSLLNLVLDRICLNRIPVKTFEKSNERSKKDRSA